MLKKVLSKKISLLGNKEIFCRKKLVLSKKRRDKRPSKHLVHGWRIGDFGAAINWKLDVEAAGAHAVRVGLELAAFAGCSQVILHSDSLIVLQALNAGSQPLGAAATMYEDCFGLMEVF